MLSVPRSVQTSVASTISATDMIRTLIVLGLVAHATSIFGFGERKIWYEGLHYHFHPIDGFFELPLTIEKADKEDYMQVKNPVKSSGFADLTLWIKRGQWCHLIGLFYDENQQVAGMMINQPIDKVNSYYNITELGLKTWNHLDVDYAYAPIFWVSEDKQTRIKSYNATKVLRDEYLTVAGFNGALDKIATNCKELGPNWCKQACIMMMGQHYYYKMTPSTTCDKPFYLWFPLTDEHTCQLIGVGFMYIGKSECNTECPSKAAVQMIVNSGPKCLYELVENYGASTVHIYFVDRPRLIGCM